MPFYDGFPMFGIAVQMVTADNPRAEQRNAFTAVNGVESLDLGHRGKVTKVVGRHFGPSAAQLFNSQQFFRSYLDGRVRLLVDSFGFAWTNVKLDSFEPTGRIQQDPDLGYTQRYQAIFVHLTPS